MTDQKPAAVIPTTTSTVVQPSLPPASFHPLTRHPASLLPITQHNPYLVRLLNQKVTLQMVHYVARQTVKVVGLDGGVDVVGRPASSSSYNPSSAFKINQGGNGGGVRLAQSLKPNRVKFTDQGHSTRVPVVSFPPITLEHFICHLVQAANVQVPTLLATLVYLERLRSKLHAWARGKFCTHHRIFISTLIITAKYLNDSSPKNLHWSQHSCIFHVDEINLMEKQLLYLLEYDLRFDEKDACRLFAPFMTLAPLSSVSVFAYSSAPNPAASTNGNMSVDMVAATRASALSKVTNARRSRSEAQQQQQTKSSHSGAGSSVSSATGLKRPPTSVVVTAVREGAQRDFRQSTAAATISGSSCPIMMSSSLSTDSTTTTDSSSSSSSSSNAPSAASSSSDLVSLVDDTGSTSPSSGSTSSGSDTDDSGMGKNFKDNVEVVDPTTTTTTTTDRERFSLSVNNAAVAHPTRELAGPGTMKKPFRLRPCLPGMIRGGTATATAHVAPSVIDHGEDTIITPTRRRIRKASDTASVHTVRGSSSPSVSSLRRVHGAHAHMLTIRGTAAPAATKAGLLSKQASTTSLVSMHRNKDGRIPTSSTMPCINGSSAVGDIVSVNAVGSGGISHRRSGTVVDRPVKSSVVVPRFRLYPAPVAAAAPAASANFGGSADVGVATRSGVGAILIRMWGAAAANLKSVSAGSGQDLEETRHLMTEEMKV